MITKSFSAVRDFLAGPRSNRFRDRLVLAVAVIATAYAALGLTSWKFSVVGDEWSFLSQARIVAENAFLVNPFDRGSGPSAGQHPLLVSYLQAILMCFFGFDLKGWRISSIVMMLPSLIVLYRFSRVLVGKNAALFAVLLMAPSKYLVNFFKIGYGHSICFFFFLLCLHLATRLLRSPSRQNAVDLGVALGLGFYIYIGPLFLLFTLPFLIAALRRFKRGVVRPLATAGLVFVAIAAVGFLTTPPDHWFGGLAKTPIGEGFATFGTEALEIGRYCLLFFTNFDYFYDHFVAGPYLDVVSRLLAFVGMIVALAAIRGRKGLLIFLWLVLCVVLSLTNPYPWTPTSRGIFLVPSGAIFAGIGLEEIRRRLPAVAKPGVIGFLLLTAITLNVYEAQIGVFKKTGYSRTALVFRELRKPSAETDDILIFHTKAVFFPDEHIKRLMEETGINPSRLEISNDAETACRTSRRTVITFSSDRSAVTQLNRRCPDLANRVRLVSLEGRYP